MHSKLVISAIILSLAVLIHVSSQQRLRVWGPVDNACIALGGYCRLYNTTVDPPYCDIYHNEIIKETGCKGYRPTGAYSCCLSVSNHYNANEECKEFCTNGTCGSDRVPGKCAKGEFCCVLVV